MPNMFLGFTKYITIFLLSMVKFVAGPTMGPAAGFTLLETMLVTVGGMMSSVVIISIFGKFLREKVFRKVRMNKKLFTKRNRRLVMVWSRYGLFGVAVLTPIFFTPIGGTLFAVAMGTPKKKLYLYMFVSAVVWSLVLTLIFQTVWPFIKSLF
jgi:hypothetical protein